MQGCIDVVFRLSKWRNFLRTRFLACHSTRKFFRASPLTPSLQNVLFQLFYRFSRDLSAFQSSIYYGPCTEGMLWPIHAQDITLVYSCWTTMSGWTVERQNTIPMYMGWTSKWKDAQRSLKDLFLLFQDGMKLPTGRVEETNILIRTNHVVQSIVIVLFVIKLEKETVKNMQWNFLSKVWALHWYIVIALNKRRYTRQNIEQSAQCMLCVWPPLLRHIWIH